MSGKKQRTVPLAEQIANARTRLGLRDPREALLVLPQRYVDLRAPVTEVPAEEDVRRRLYLLRFTGQWVGHDAQGREIDLADPGRWRFVRRLDLEFEGADGGRIWARVFGATWGWREMVRDEAVPLMARASRFGPELRLEEIDRPPAHAVGSVWPQYGALPGAKGASGTGVEAMVRQQLEDPQAVLVCESRVVGALGVASGRAAQVAREAGIEHEFEELASVIRGLHRPSTPEQGLRALACARMLGALAVREAALRAQTRVAHRDAPLPIDEAEVRRLADAQPEKLTGDQLAALDGIVQGLRQPRPLNALVSGDVGVGKTLPYLIAAVAAHRAGARVAIVAPTAILADQIALQVAARFPDVPMQRVLTGKRIASPDAILVGTTGLASVMRRAGVTPHVLICDEQHKMGTAAREALVQPWTHVIEVSATPVPRSMASAKFGGMQVFNIRECAVAKTFVTEVGSSEDKRRFLTQVAAALERGERATVVYPRVNRGQDESIGVLQGAAALEQAFPGRVVAIHGGMQDEEIARCLEQVKSGERPLLVASTIVETGIDIPDMTALIVRDADRFGISQLHQLRGRMARRGGVGRFMMQVDRLEELTEETRQRLEALCQCTDGYELAEIDLNLRGFGELDGLSQTGETDACFKMVNLTSQDYLRVVDPEGAQRLAAKVSLEPKRGARGAATAAVQDLGQMSLALGAAAATLRRAAGALAQSKGAPDLDGGPSGPAGPASPSGPAGQDDSRRDVSAWRHGRGACARQTPSPSPTRGEGRAPLPADPPAPVRTNAFAAEAPVRSFASRLQGTGLARLAAACPPAPAPAPAHAPAPAPASTSAPAQDCRPGPDRSAARGLAAEAAAPPAGGVDLARRLEALRRRAGGLPADAPALDHDAPQAAWPGERMEG